MRTLLYADLFDYPLTPEEVHYYLIGLRASSEAVRAALQSSPWLLARTASVNGYVTVRGREAIGAVRDKRRRASARLWPRARRWAAVIGALPFVRMVAVTGALAVDNAPAGDDVDFCIVTAPRRVWLARGLTVLIVRAARLWGMGLCPNYVLAETALAQQRRDLYVAHDLVQMVSLVGHGVLADMRAANPWVAEFLPHAQASLRREPDLSPRGLAARVQRMAEWLLGGRLGDAIEAWERRRKLARFTRAADRLNSAAELDAERVKGHFDDHGEPILRRFEERCQRLIGSATATSDQHVPLASDAPGASRSLFVAASGPEAG